ncbi:response regulator [Paenibacillus humicola]|uniref:response regulator n=1 Tax=Paenibacillus humicola TaxID=3110540 RepID=UPI00237BAD65|nr:response regulator [Paenibacillus humicola]
MWTIAIIDDDRQVLKGMKQVIPWEDIDARWAGESLNGARGLELIREEQPDIVITDIYMPVMSGIAMIEKLHEEGYEGKIIIHSGYSDFEVARKALRLNVGDYLSKPVSRDTLREVLQRAIAELEGERRTKQEQERLRDKLMAYEPFVHRERLKSMITGTASEWDEDGLTAQLGGPGRRHLVLGIEILRTARIAEARLSDRLIFRFAVQNIIEEIAHAAHAAFDYIELHGYYSALVLHAGEDEDAGVTVRRMADRIVRCVQQYLQLSVRIGIGGLKNNAAELPESFEEAFHFLSQEHRVLHTPGVFDFAAERESGLISRTLTAGRPMKFYHHLVEDMKETQGKNAAKIIASYIASLRNDREIGVPQLRALGTQFWAIIGYALNDEEIRLDELVKDDRIEQELSTVCTLDQYEAWLNQMVGAVCRHQDWHENFKHRLTIDFIKQYIHEHYAREITIAELASEVYISKNYLCQIFKNGTGETINNYIIRVKMEKAKSLLLERKLKIFEVAENVGYKSIPYFSTTFKKYYGVTPAELIS